MTVPGGRKGLRLGDIDHLQNTSTLTETQHISGGIDLLYLAYTGLCLWRGSIKLFYCLFMLQFHDKIKENVNRILQEHLLQQIFVKHFNLY